MPLFTHFLSGFLIPFAVVSAPFGAFSRVKSLICPEGIPKKVIRFFAESY
jgi:hypothetical protein